MPNRLVASLFDVWWVEDEETMRKMPRKSSFDELICPCVNTTSVDDYVPYIMLSLSGE